MKECEYSEYRNLDYSSWYCGFADGVVSQDICRRICRYCPKEDWKEGNE